MANDNYFFASDLAFKPTLTQSGDLSTVTDREAINQSIYNIIMTPRGSRVMNPDFGAGVMEMLFEPLTEDIAQTMGKSIVAQIILWEPRINIVSTEMKVFDSPQAGYDISITYVILSTLTSGTFQTFLPKTL